VLEMLNLLYLVRLIMVKIIKVIIGDYLLMEQQEVNYYFYIMIIIYLECLEKNKNYRLDLLNYLDIIK
jgi:hypothetical protein